MWRAHCEFPTRAITMRTLVPGSLTNSISLWPRWPGAATIARGGTRSRVQNHTPVTAIPMIASTTRVMPLSVPRILSFKFLNSKTSVRSRIVAIAVIPLVGFLTNGITFTAGETDVAGAFRSAEHATELADASEEFKAGLAAMRMGIRDFIADPSQDAISAFEAGSAQVSQSLHTIESSVSVDERPVLFALTRSIAAVQDDFLTVKKEQRNLGFTDTDGIRGNLNRTGAAVETIIDQELTWVADEDARKLMISLLTMRRHEAEYRLSRAPALRSRFSDEAAHFNSLFDSVDGAPSMREQLIEQVQTYADTFAQWVAGVEKVGSLIVSIDSDIESMTPIADKILGNARERVSAASAALSASQARTRQIIIWVGCVAALIGLAFSWWIGRSITRPLSGLAKAMTRLA
ncbi:MAG TPA: hypothetical protein VGN55_07465, partial [Xanthobacteraceae bacterium]